MSYRWEWAVFVQPVATGEPTTYLGWIAAGLEATVGIALAGWIIALAVGTAMGIVRTLPGRWLYWVFGHLRRGVSKYPADRAVLHLVLGGPRTAAGPAR